MEVESIEKLVKILKKNRVSSFKNGDLNIKFHFEPKVEEVPKVYDVDSRPKDGHRLRPPSETDIAKERLVSW